MKQMHVCVLKRLLKTTIVIRQRNLISGGYIPMSAKKLLDR